MGRCYTHIVSTKHLFFSPSLALLLGALASSVACAPARPAESAPPAAAPSEDATMPAKTAEPAPQQEAANEPPTPSGQLVCQASADGNKEQLYLEWEGDMAKGTLRTFTQSGKVRYEPVRAERYKARIVIDDPESTDLAVHKATLVDSSKGKQIQIGDYNAPWTKCN
jgi:hypothetical protein